MDLKDYISAGYYITHYVERPTYTDSKLLPRKILSLSDCIANFFPNDWSISWVKMDEEKRKEEALAFGLNSDAVSQAVDSLTSRFDQDFGYPNVCYSLKIARDLVNEFLLNKTDLTIIGVGLHSSIKQKFCDEMMPPPPKEGYAPIGKTGILEMVLKDQVLEHETQILGFELVNFYMGSEGCSWLCNSLEKEVKEKLNMIPNNYGFIDNFNDASKASEHVSKDEVGAEPGLWLPLLITQYSL